MYSSADTNYWPIISASLVVITEQSVWSVKYDKNSMGQFCMWLNIVTPVSIKVASALSVSVVSWVLADSWLHTFDIDMNTVQLPSRARSLSLLCCTCVCVCLHSCSFKVKFVQECGVVTCELVGGCEVWFPTSLQLGPRKWMLSWPMM